MKCKQCGQEMPERTYHIGQKIRYNEIHDMIAVVGLDNQVAIIAENGKSILNGKIINVGNQLEITQKEFDKLTDGSRVQVEGIDF